MSRDGKLKNDRPIRFEVPCLCPSGGTLYKTPSARYARCSNGVTHCIRCLRQAKKFRSGWTCGPGCVEARIAYPTRPDNIDTGSWTPSG